MDAGVRTLVVSQGYEPLNVISWQRAFTLLSMGKVEVVEEYEDERVHTVSLVFRVPAVVRLLHKVRWFRREVKFSRVNIYARDNFTCQYCGEKHSAPNLTFDHVVPRAQGGETSWTNVVTACSDCNTRKKNRTPGQAGLQLLRKPVQPEWVPAIVIQISRQSVPDAWRDYLYWTSELKR